MGRRSLRQCHLRSHGRPFRRRLCRGVILKHLSNLAASVATHVLLISAAAEGVPADWVQLLPFGQIKGRDGRSWVLDPADAEEVIAASVARAANADLVVDYDHQSDFAAKPGVGGRAPASGWIKELPKRDDGI